MLHQRVMFKISIIVRDLAKEKGRERERGKGRNNRLYVGFV